MSKIVVWPEPVLRQKSEQVNAIDDELLADIKKLRKILLKSDNGAGLASNQIGVAKRFFGLKNSDGKVDVFINPKIIKTRGKKVYSSMVDEEGRSEPFLEGCLSFPDLFGAVKRWLEIEVEWEAPPLRGDMLVKKRQKLTGFEAIVWQHESDHLDGVVFLDHIKKEKGKLFLIENKNKKEVDVDQILSK